MDVKHSGVAISATWTDDKGWSLSVARHGFGAHGVAVTHRYRYEGLSNSELVDVIDVALSDLT